MPGKCTSKTKLMLTLRRTLAQSTTNLLLRLVVKGVMGKLNRNILLPWDRQISRLQCLIRPKKTATKARNDSRQKNLEAKLVPILDVSKLAEKNPAINDLLKLQLEWHRLTDSSIPPKGQVSKFNKEALKKALIEAVTKLNNEEIAFLKVKVKDSSERFNLERDSGGKEDEED